MGLALEDAAGLTAAEVVHRRFGAMPATATIGDVRAWFAESAHRRMAFLADGERFAGALTRADVSGRLDALKPAVTVAQPGPTVAPDASAREGYEAALRTEARRAPVVAADGTLVGVVAVTEDLTSFCGVPELSRVRAAGD